MDGERRRRDRARSLVIGGLLGASAVFATGKRQRRRRKRGTLSGLAAFESAPCFRELLENEEPDEPRL
jgi:hypothetical protein